MHPFLLAILACADPTTPTGPTDVTETEDTTPPWLHSGVDHSTPAGEHSGLHSADSGHSAATPAIDCSVDPPQGPFPYTSTAIIRTEEDFDFDATQYLLTQRLSALAGITRTGVEDILAANIGSDAAGIRSLPTGEVLVAQPDSGTVRRVDLRTGGSVAVLTGLTAPNGIEVASSGASFVSEFVPNGRVREFNPFTGDFQVIATLSQPNNMVLSPDEQTLYVVTSQGWYGSGNVVALDRDGNGGWSAPRDVFRGNEFLGGITVDLCGDLYLTQYSTGRVFRLRIPEGTPELIAELPRLYGSYSAAHFSPGLAGWSTHELYVTNRSQFFVVDVGVEGRHVLR